MNRILEIFIFRMYRVPHMRGDEPKMGSTESCELRVPHMRGDEPN